MEIQKKQKNLELKVSKLQLIKLVTVTFLLFFISSCKSTKTGAITSITKKNSAKEIVLAHNAQDFKFKTLQSKLRVTYNDGKNSFSPSATLRMEKDQKIWMSIKVLGITMAKAYITPTRVSFYDKLNKQFYDGDFKALSNFLGTQVSFQMLQNLIVGQSIVPLDKSFKVSHTIENQTQLAPNPQNQLYSLLVSLYNLNIKVASLKLEQKNESIEIDYKVYQKVGEQNFPKSINIVSKSNNQSKQIKMEFKSVNSNQSITFPYSVPEGYKALLIN